MIHIMRIEQSSTNAKHSVKVKYFLYLLKNVSVAQFQRISTAYNFPPELYLTLSKEHRCWVLGHKLNSQHEFITFYKHKFIECYKIHSSMSSHSG